MVHPALLIICIVIPVCVTPREVSFPTRDGGIVVANLYGTGENAVILAHGGRFNKESWDDQADVLSDAGYMVLALDFRGRGKSLGGPGAERSDDSAYIDILAAVRFVRDAGANKVAVVGASFGGWAAARAAVAEPGEIDRLVLLATSVDDPELLTPPKLFIVTRDDTRGDGVIRLTEIRDQFARSPEPKKLVVLDGEAHAQYIFETDQGERLMREIQRFLGDR